MTPSGLTPVEQAEYRRRQRSRAVVMAWVLGGLVVLFFAISMAKLL